MCTDLTLTTPVAGSALGGGEWFDLDRAVVSFDHPSEARLEYALCLDLRGAGGDPARRVAVELDAGSARRLAEAILAALDHPEVRDLVVLP